MEEETAREITAAEQQKALHKLSDMTSDSLDISAKYFIGWSLLNLVLPNFGEQANAPIETRVKYMRNVEEETVKKYAAEWTTIYNKDRVYALRYAISPSFLKEGTCTTSSVESIPHAEFTPAAKEKPITILAGQHRKALLVHNLEPLLTKYAELAEKVDDPNHDDSNDMVELDNLGDELKDHGNWVVAWYDQGNV